MIIGRERKAKIEARLLALAHLRVRTKPLDSVQSRLSWPDRLTLAAGVLVLLLFVSLIVAILANVIGAH